MRDEWFRNKTWSEAVERAFNDKLRRARHKEQYLRIQASTLATTHPEIALQLLDRYFEFPDNFDHAQAFVDRATAFVALGQVDQAIDAYEDALARENEFPKLLTDAYLALPFLVATGRIRQLYERAQEVLDTNHKRLVFPVDHFRWHASQALIAADSQRGETAREHAKKALEAAAREKSGFRYHPSVGLVGRKYEEIIAILEARIAA